MKDPESAEPKEKPNFRFFPIPGAEVSTPGGAPGATRIFFSFTAAQGGGFPNERRRRPLCGAYGAAPPEGEGNPAEGVCFASIYINV